MKTKTLASFAALTLFATRGIPIQTFAQNAQPSSASQTDPKAQAKILGQYGKLPLSFEANQGQTDSKVKFLSRGHGYSFFLTRNEAVIALKKAAQQSDEMKGFPNLKRFEPQKEKAAKGTVVRMELAGVNARPRMVGAEELPGKANYFIGNDPSKWRTNVPTYAKVKYEGVYPGVDLIYYGNQGQLEYDFVVAPGVNPSEIRLKFRGAGKLRVDEKGDLLLGSAGEEVRFEKPVVYQEVAGEKKPVEGSYFMASANRIGFRLGEYDHSQPLVIDPILDYSTYLGGSNYDFGSGIAVDSSGNAYVTGYTASTDFPSVNALQSTLAGPQNAFVTKIDPSGSALIYSTYLGGSVQDAAIGIAVDASGNAYVTGFTLSTNFPTANALQATLAGFQNAFVTKINPGGSALIYSTYLGGTIFDYGSGVAVDTSGNAYVTGTTFSIDFPTLNALQATYGGGGALNPGDAFVTKIDPSGSALIYSTYLGGNGADNGIGIAVDSSGNAYVTGHTNSTNFPTVNALQATYGNPRGCGNFLEPICWTAFVTKINPDGSALVYSTYLGGKGDSVNGGNIGDSGDGIAVDAFGNAYVTGYTSSTDFPTANALQATLAGIQNAFVTKINPGGSELIYSTYLGGSGDDNGNGIAVDSSGNVYLTGFTGSTNFPTVKALQSTLAGSQNAFVTKINPSGSALVYSTYLGGNGSDDGNGIAVDASGNAYVTGYTQSTNFPTVNALQPTYGGVLDAFVAKIGPRFSVCLLYDPTKAVQSGATIPIKLQLCDGNGNDLSSSSIAVHATSVSQISTSTSSEVEDFGNSNPDDDFRFDATLGSTGGYIFNLKTRGLSTGTYSLNFTVTGDSFVYAADFEVK